MDDAVLAAQKAPLHAFFTSLGSAFLIGALVTDGAYVLTVGVQWETFSIWLLTFGLVFTAAAAIALLFDLATGRSRLRPAWGRLGLGAAAALLSVVNAFVHSRDGYTAVMPTGLLLSAVVTVLLVILGVGGWRFTRPTFSSAAR